MKWYNERNTNDFYFLCRVYSCVWQFLSKFMSIEQANRQVLRAGWQMDTEGVEVNDVLRTFCFMYIGTSSQKCLAV